MRTARSRGVKDNSSIRSGAGRNYSRARYAQRLWRLRVCDRSVSGGCCGFAFMKRVRSEIGTGTVRVVGGLGKNRNWEGVSSDDADSPATSAVRERRADPDVGKDGRDGNWIASRQLPIVYSRLRMADFGFHISEGQWQMRSWGDGEGLKSEVQTRAGLSGAGLMDP
jgi:hypothetical protein